MRETRRLLLAGVVALVLASIFSCEMVTLNEEPVEAAAGATPGYPSIQAIMDESLDAALHVVTNASARSAIPDPKYDTFASVLRRARQDRRQDDQGVSAHGAR